VHVSENNFLKNHSQNFKKFNKYYKPTDLRSPMIPKGKKCDKNNTKTHHTFLKLAIKKKPYQQEYKDTLCIEEER
jgi:hypothetical protein